MLWTCRHSTALSQRFETTRCNRRDSDLISTWEVCAIQQRNLSQSRYVRARTRTLPLPRRPQLRAPMDVSQMSSNVVKTETEEESDTYQYEQDQECHGHELFAVKNKGKGGLKGTCFKCGMRGHEKLIDVGRKERVKEVRETGRKEKVDPKERDGPKENGQILVTRGTVLGTLPVGIAKRMVSRWIRGRLLNLFFISVQLV